MTQIRPPSNIRCDMAKNRLSLKLHDLDKILSGDEWHTSADLGHESQLLLYRKVIDC